MYFVCLLFYSLLLFSCPWLSFSTWTNISSKSDVDNRTVYKISFSFFCHKERSKRTNRPLTVIEKNIKVISNNPSCFRQTEKKQTLAILQKLENVINTTGWTDGRRTWKLLHSGMGKTASTSIIPFLSCCHTTCALLLLNC